MFQTARTHTHSSVANNLPTFLKQTKTGFCTSSYLLKFSLCSLDVTYTQTMSYHRHTTANGNLNDKVYERRAPVFTFTALGRVRIAMSGMVCNVEEVSLTPPTNHLHNQHRRRQAAMVLTLALVLRLVPLPTSVHSTESAYLPFVWCAQSVEHTAREWSVGEVKASARGE